MTASDHGPQLVHLRAAGVSLVVSVTPLALPRVLHWGADLGDLDDAALADLAVAASPQSASSMPDEAIVATLVPENAWSWPGWPGLEGHRGGRAFATRFAPTGVTLADDDRGVQRLTVTAADAAAELALTVTLDLTPTGLVRVQARLTNQGGPYTLNGLTLALPVPEQAGEILDFGGHHGHERAPQRHAFTQGTHLRENRRGRTGLDATLLLIAGEPGFSFRSGEVWGVHVAWSGNHRTLAERQPSGERLLAGGELLLPGEIELGPGEEYQTPWLYGSYGVGLDQLSARFHQELRAVHPLRRPRPVIGNSWEAVYFDHRLKPLSELADALAEVGVERFVLDDGWFRHRRHDRAGLGDWYVDEGVWPMGLHPLVDHVRGLGLEFGLWVEPEMVSPDSDLARAHPDWILAAGERLPAEWRHQQVLNLACPGAYAYIEERLTALIEEYRLDYLKWDHNRDLVEAGDRTTGRPAVHAQTLAAYRLIAGLKARYPDLEIESCSSGGGRADLGILGLVDRMWASDDTDAHERQMIQRYTGLLVPPEMMGCHISADPNHGTYRRLSLGMRAVTALFGSLGVEWNVAAIDPAERAALARWIALYKDWREVIHTGELVHCDVPNPAFWCHGVVAADRSRALFAVVPMATSMTAPPGLVRLPGLDPAACYRVEPAELSRAVVASYIYQPLLWWTQGVTLTGLALARHGLRLPDLPPDDPVLITVTREGSA
ncbi:MAG: alpha-galactosidase [Propionibacteriaceae bacterium]|jgi:alpha-galactosidase|nr:alpha-galactosidase [Propionibacteriaceae bacterium]